MRFVPAKILREGMVLGKSLYDHSHNILLSKGHVLTQGNITRIVELGYQGIYITLNELENEEDVKELVSQQLRLKAIDAVTRIFVNDDTSNDQNDLLEIIHEIINQLMNHKALILNLYDLKTYDDYTFQHSVNVTILSLIVGIKMDYREEQLFDLGFGAIMHDIGKKMIDLGILNKKAALNGDEMLIIRNHALLGSQLMQNIFEVNQDVVNCALHHHERFDGQGYPFGLVGEEISLNGRIIAICDVFDALTSNRIYRKAIAHNDAIDYIKKNSGSHFDTNLVRVFLEHVAPYPIGTMVKLNNGQQGIVVQVKPKKCSRPTVKILADIGNKIIRQPYDIDLSEREEEDIFISHVILEEE